MTESASLLSTRAVASTVTMAGKAEAKNVNGNLGVIGKRITSAVAEPEPKSGPIFDRPKFQALGEPVPVESLLKALDS